MTSMVADPSVRVRLPLFEPPPPSRPRTRAECIDGPRPCPWVGCRENTYLDVLSNGSIRENHPGIEPDAVPAETSCTLDVANADPDGVTLNVVALVLGIEHAATVREIETAALRRAAWRRFQEYVDPSVDHHPSRGHGRDAAPTSDDDNAEDEVDRDDSVRISFFGEDDELVCSWIWDIVERHARTTYAGVSFSSARPAADPSVSGLPRASSAVIGTERADLSCETTDTVAIVLCIGLSIGLGLGMVRGLPVDAGDDAGVTDAGAEVGSP